MRPVKPSQSQAASDDVETDAVDVPSRYRDGVEAVDELLSLAPPGCRPLHLHRYGNTYGTAFIIPIELPGRPGVPDWKHTPACDSPGCLRLVGLPPALFAQYVLASRSPGG